MWHRRVATRRFNEPAGRLRSIAPTIEPLSGRYLDSIEPATEKPYSQVADSDTLSRSSMRLPISYLSQFFSQKKLLWNFFIASQMRPMAL